MSPDGTVSGVDWTVVRAVDLSATRRRLEIVLGDGSKHYATIDRELDTPARREAIVQLLLSDRHVAKSPRGPIERPAPAPSPWIES